MKQQPDSADEHGDFSTLDEAYTYAELIEAQTPGFVQAPIAAPAKEQPAA